MPRFLTFSDLFYSFFSRQMPFVRFTAAAADDERRRVSPGPYDLITGACAVCDNDDAPTHCQLNVGRGKKTG